MQVDIAGMVLGAHAMSLMNQEILDSTIFKDFEHILECAVGLMIGTELIWHNSRCGRHQ